MVVANPIETKKRLEMMITNNIINNKQLFLKTILTKEEINLFREQLS
jgi:hypothetical protein